MPNVAELRAARTSGSQRGFTLIEVLVALVVVAVSMTAAILAVSERTRDGTYLRDKTLAHWIAMNLVTERRLQTEAPPLGKTGDEVEFAGRRWRWSMVVDKTAVDSMRRMDVSVRMADAPEDSSLASVTGFFGTAIAPAGTSAPWPDVGPQGGQPAENAGEEEKAQEDEQTDDDQSADDGTDATDDGSGDEQTDGSGDSEDSGDSGDSGDSDQPVVPHVEGQSDGSQPGQGSTR
jgi:general secretion pathway protein I